MLSFFAKVKIFTVVTFKGVLTEILVILLLLLLNFCVAILACIFQRIKFFNFSKDGFESC